MKKYNPDYQAYICEVLEHYLKLGVSGFRLDVADELPNQFLELIRKKVKSVNPEAIIIAEVWEDAILKEAYNERKDYLLGKKSRFSNELLFEETIVRIYSNRW